jgi:LPXTG-motif cell wall-anchored protein
MQKTNFKTRLLALLTAVFMVIVSIPFAAFADDDEIMYIKYYANNGSKLLSSGEFHKSWEEYTLLDNLQNNDIPEGQKLVGWTSTADSSKVLKGTYSWDDLSKYAQGGTLSLDAVFESEAPATQNVGLVYYDFTNKVKALEKEVTVSADKTSFTAEEVKAYLPDGYELEDATKTSFDIAGGYVSIPVVKKAVPTTKTIKINYYSEAEKKQIAEVEMTVGINDTYINTSKLTAPKGYKIDETGDLQIRDGYVYVAVSKVEVPTTKTIKINYYSEAEEKQIAEVEMTVGINDTYINTSKLTAPKGYKIDETGDLQIRDGYVYVAVSKVEVPTTKTIKINYYSEAEEKQIAEVEMTVGINDTYINTSKLTAPEGYELVLAGDLAIRDGYVYAAVNKIGSKTVKINYYSEAEEKQIAEVEMTVAPDATCVNTSKLTAPTGYELVEVGDLPIRDGYVYAAVRKVSTKEVKINFYCPEEKKQVAEPTVVVNADATYVNSSAYAALVPAGYELAEVGDMPIRDGYVYAEVRKVATKTIKINYYSEEEEKQIAEVEMTVPADATYVNTSKLTAPAGYELVLAGDLPIRDGYVYAAVRKVPTTTIKISYVDEATDKEVGTEDLVVNQGTTVVNFNVLKSVPAGYELCEVGDFYVGNGSAKVMVRKTKSNNGSSSSSSSSSSNKTTTASSKAEQKVVKAAAAPANTTKVLPKTGASNVAPLLGGSLAVVALLMGYGVYSLVLRKKD